MIDFETWWNSSSADEFRRLNDDMDGRVVRPVWDAAIRATLSSQKATSAAPSPEATQPTQAEAPSEREALRELVAAFSDHRDAQGGWGNGHREQILKTESRLIKALAGARAALATQQADNWQQYAKDGETAQAVIERHRKEQDGLLALLAQARATQQAVQGEPVAVAHKGRHVGSAGVHISRLAALDELPDGVHKLYTTPPSPGQVERDREDAENWRYIRRKLCLTGNGDGTCSMQAINLPASIPGWPESGQVAEFCDDAIRAARSSERGV